MYAQMFGEEMIVRADYSDLSETLDDYDEAIMLYEDMLQDCLLFRPEDKDEINLLNREIQECRCAKRELWKALKKSKKENKAA